MKFSVKLTLVLVLFAAVLLAAVASLAYVNGRDSLEAAARAELLSTALEKEAALDAWILDQKNTVVALAESPGVQNDIGILTSAAPDSAEARAARASLLLRLEPWSNGNDQFLELNVLDPQTGEVIASTDAFNEGKFRENMPYFIEGRSGAFVQPVYYSLDTQSIAMTASAPVFSQDGRLLAVLAGGLNLANMNEIVQRRTGLHQTDDAFLVNPSHLIVTPPRFLPDPRILQSGVRTEAVNKCLDGKSGTISALDYRGVQAIIVHRWMPERGMCLIVKKDREEILAPTRSFGRTIGIAGGLTFVCAAALAYLLARTITRPILDLQAGAAHFGQGNLEHRLTVKGRDELAQLGNTFNEMAGRLQASRGELEAANKELEAFAYSVSHDLRAPLRAINGFTRILLEGHAASLDAEGARYFNLVLDNARQMGQLVDDLLALSRLGRQALAMKRVSPRKIVGQSLAELQADMDGRKIEIEIADLPECRADPSLLKQVFINLLANAVKFTRARETARIEIGFERKDGATTYFVRDNGVGFDMRYVDKLFGVFQRLHRAEEYEGTGVGLAIVQRIIQRHGGRVWAQAEVDKGATFYFTIG